MIKKFTFLKLLILFFFLTNCGFKVVNQSELINFMIGDISISGDNKISYIIKNKLLPYSRDNGEGKVTLDIDVKKNKEIKEKNIKNEITKFEVTINAIINYTKNTSGKFEISKKGEFIVTNQYSQTLINEKGLVKNLSEDLAEDIIKELINRQDDL